MSALNRIFFDTEFVEDGTTIELLSIGLVAADGRTYYAEPAETDRSRAGDWVKANVIPHLTGPVKPRAQIAAEIVEFAGKKPEFWAYFASYDWVALCQLYGTMMELPKGWPMMVKDLKQKADAIGNPRLPKQTSTEHNALADAIWTKQAFDFLQTFERSAEIAHAPLDAFALASALHPDLFDENERKAHMAASPNSVEFARSRALSEALDTLALIESIAAAKAVEPPPVAVIHGDRYLRAVALKGEIERLRPAYQHQTCVNAGRRQMLQFLEGVIDGRNRATFADT